MSMVVLPVYWRLVLIFIMNSQVEIRSIESDPIDSNEIVHGKRAVTADTAIRLAKYFGTSEQFWTGLQADYDLEEARKLIDLNSIQKVA
jgi:addiction module HigA family antidote